MRKVFTLLLELRCQNFCVFCGQREVDETVVRVRRLAGLSTPATAFGAKRARYTLESAVAALRSARDDGFKELSLQGGEPTLFPDVVQVVAAARSLGFERIGIVTNGRKLAVEAFAEALVGAGLDDLSLSLVGWDEATHDAISLAHGAFAQLIAGVRNAVAAAARLERRVTVNVNLTTSAATVDHLPDQVRLLATLGVDAASIHLVRFGGLAADPVVRETMRFDIRRITPALTLARTEATRLGMPLHATDVPICLHDSLVAEELALVLHRADIDQHTFQAPDHSYQPQPARLAVHPVACSGCVLERACPHVPPEYLPADPSTVLRPLTPARVTAYVDEELAALEPTDHRAAGRVADLARSIDLLTPYAGAEALAGASARLRGAFADLAQIAHAGSDWGYALEACCGYFDLHAHRSPAIDSTWLGAPLAELARRTRAIPSSAASGARLRFVHPFEVSLTGTSSGNGDFVLSAVRPVLPAPAQRVSKSLLTLFLAHICRPLLGARRLRVTSESLEVDHGDGFRAAWSFRRGGAITLVPHPDEALSAD